MEPLKVISLGWGVQSFALAAMSATGALPKVDLCIHADTTHEQQATYDFAARWKVWLEERGLPIMTVQPERTTGVIDEWGGVFIPAYTDSESGGGILNRQCTYEWKIRPIRKALQEIREGRKIEMWLGITYDEISRMKESNVKYITHRWPFLEPEIWGHPMSRQDVIKWLADNDLECPPRSSCYFCPFHNNKEWKNIQESEDWQRALQFDEDIRNRRPPFDLFVHQARQPLSTVDLSTPQEKGQLDLFQNECSGICGL